MSIYVVMRSPVDTFSMAVTLGRVDERGIQFLQRPHWAFSELEQFIAEQVKYLREKLPMDIPTKILDPLVKACLFDSSTSTNETQQYLVRAFAREYACKEAILNYACLSFTQCCGGPEVTLEEIERDLALLLDPST